MDRPGFHGATSVDAATKSENAGGEGKLREEDRSRAYEIELSLLTCAEGGNWWWWYSLCMMLRSLFLLSSSGLSLVFLGAIDQPVVT